MFDDLNDSNNFYDIPPTAYCLPLTTDSLKCEINGILSSKMVLHLHKEHG